MINDHLDETKHTTAIEHIENNETDGTYHATDTGR